MNILTYCLLEMMAICFEPVPSAMPQKLTSVQQQFCGLSRRLATKLQTVCSWELGKWHWVGSHLGHGSFFPISHFGALIKPKNQVQCCSNIIQATISMQIIMLAQWFWFEKNMWEQYSEKFWIGWQLNQKKSQTMQKESKSRTKIARMVNFDVKTWYFVRGPSA